METQLIFGHRADEHLTEHFTLGEMLYSETAVRMRVLNPVDDAAIIDNLLALCQQVLEPLRRSVCQPIRISSGYRSAFINYVVGGAEKSQHRLGEAADLSCPMGEQQARFYYDFIRLHLPFDQLLLEHRKKTGSWWVHVSHTRRRPPRRDARELAV